MIIKSVIGREGLSNTLDETRSMFWVRIFKVIKLQSWTKGWRQIHKIKQNKFFYGMFYS